MRSFAIALLAACGDDVAPGSDAASTDGAPASCEPGTPWAAAPPTLHGPTQETAVVALAGKIYVLGGFDDTLAVLDRVQVFDTTTCAWAFGPALPKPVHHANAAVVGDRIYVVGAMQTIQFASIGDTWSWAPGESAWTVHTAMPAGTERGAAVTGAIDGKIHVVGGLRNGSVADHSVYDPTLDEWSPRTALASPRDHGCGAAIDGVLYVAGGRGGNIGAISDSVVAFVPDGNGTWVDKAPMITGRGGVGCGVVDGKLVVVGGEGNAAADSGVFPQAESYDPIANMWTTLADMPTPRHGMGAAAWERSLYVPGGATQQGFGAVATHEILTP